MSIIRDFWVGVPGACGVPEGLAEIYGRLNGELFDWEQDHANGALNRKHFGSVASRIDLGFCSWVRLVNLEWEDEDPVNFARDLLEYTARTIDAEGGDWRGKAQRRAALEKQALLPQNAHIVALLTVEEASTMSSWA